MSQDRPVDVSIVGNTVTPIIGEAMSQSEILELSRCNHEQTYSKLSMTNDHGGR
jgi:hypothetical protein